MSDEQDVGMDEIDTGAAAPEVDETLDELVSGQIGQPGPGLIEYDIEFSHPRQTGIVTVFAHDPETAKAALKIKIEARYGAGDDLVILDIEAAASEQENQQS